MRRFFRGKVKKDEGQKEDFFEGIAKGETEEMPGEKMTIGQEILAAMNGLDEELVEILPQKGGKKEAPQKRVTARRLKWAVAAVCSLCLLGGSAVFAASNISWHTKKHTDPHMDENEPPMSDLWVEYEVPQVPVDAFTGSVRDVEKIFKEDIANGIELGEGIPRGWVEMFDTEEEAIEYVGFEGLRRTALPDWTTWHIQLAVFGDEEGNLMQVVINAHYKIDEYKVGNQNRLVAAAGAEIYTENWMYDRKCIGNGPVYDSEEVQGREYQTKSGKTGLILAPKYDGSLGFWMEGYMIEGNIIYSLSLRYNGLIYEEGLAEDAVTKVMYEWMEQF